MNVKSKKIASSNKQYSSIGMFDSGVGGLTVMRQMIEQLPSESIIYFGDTARVPYGNKSSETIIRYSIENAHFLMQKNIKLLVVACNTASAYALEKLQNMSTIPVVGVIEPGAEKAVQITQNKRIGIVGTKGTIRSGAYQKAIQQRLEGAEIFTMACPLFVPLVEESFLFHPASKMIVKEYLFPLKQHKIDTLLLGCTHYPLLHHLIQKEMGSEVTIVDSANTCAEAVAKTLRTHRLSAVQAASPTHHFFVSDDAEAFQTIGNNFLGISIDCSKVDI